MRLGATSCASQILLNRVLGILLAPPQSGGDDGEEDGLVRSGVLEVMGKVGVERDGVAGVQLVPLAVDAQRDGAALDVRDLARARLVQRRVVRVAGGRA